MKNEQKVLWAKIVLTSIRVWKELSTKVLELKVSSTTCAACIMLSLIFMCGISRHDMPKCFTACIFTESQQCTRRLPHYIIGLTSQCVATLNLDWFQPTPTPVLKTSCSMKSHISRWTDWGQKTGLIRWEYLCRHLEPRGVQQGWA